MDLNGIAVSTVQPPSKRPVASAHTGFQYQPEQTTSAIVCHHPQAKYFIARSPREQRNADQG